MQTDRQAGTVIFVSTRCPAAAIARGIEAHGLAMRWASSIEAAVGLIDAGHEKAVVVTELAMPDGNWRDLVERIRCSGVIIPTVLVTSSSTAELWWDALECGIDDILPGPLTAFPLCQFLETHFGP
jgi:DNA-binding response OmpR family regulator